jgi:hypothetical protein
MQDTALLNCKCNTYVEIIWSRNSWEPNLLYYGLQVQIQPLSLMWDISIFLQNSLMTFCKAGSLRDKRLAAVERISLAQIEMTQSKLSCLQPVSIASLATYLKYLCFVLIHTFPFHPFKYGLEQKDLKWINCLSRKQVSYTTGLLLQTNCVQLLSAIQGPKKSRTAHQFQYQNNHFTNPKNMSEN